MNTYTMSILRTLVLVGALGARASVAQTVVSDDFNGTTTTNSWYTVGGACLTAASYGSNPGSTVPGCVGLPYYNGKSLTGMGSTPDTPFSPSVPTSGGALRLTDGYPNGYSQYGAIISNFTFPNNAGLLVTFKTITYGGDSGGANKDGADGISFFLMDGSPTLDGLTEPYDVGAVGGSLGYTCSNVNNDGRLHSDGTQRGYDGLVGGYIGLGIDEYGNFLNQGDNTASGYGYIPNRIGLRGAGAVSWAALAYTYPNYYPSTGANNLYNLTSGGTKLSSLAVQNTCRTGYLWDYSTPTAPKQTNTPVADYGVIPGAYSILPSTVNIANEAARVRTAATPIFYRLKITQNGLLSFSYGVGGSYLPVINKQDITQSNGAVPQTLRFGFTGSTGGSTNVHEILCFQAAPADQSASSAGLNRVESSKLDVGSQVYFAYYNPNNWSGSLTATGLSIDASNNVSVNPLANWDAACVLGGVLSGASCASTGVAGPTAPQAPTARTILTSSGGQGVAFEWATISGAQQTALDLGDSPAGTPNRLNYLRGDSSNEITALGVGLFRNRDGILADIVDSSPSWVGPPTAPYKVSFTDLLDATPAQEPAGSYAAFASTNATRLNVVYVGANDGLLHGFESGSLDVNGAFVANATTPNDGKEVLAYMPAGVVNTIHNSVDPTLDFSNASYGHAFSVDATPGTGDLYYAGAWHTFLVGGLAAGGAEIYALDITTPANFSEAAGTAASTVIGDWTPSTLTCTSAPSACGAFLGNTWGIPVIRRFHNGQWGAVFGNGLGNASGAAGVYIMLFNPTSAAPPTTYYLSIPATSTGNGNGIAYTSPADLDGDHIVDYIYAGDFNGNIWRFDVTSANPGNWAVGANPLFSTGGSSQPITTKLMVASVPSITGAPKIIVAFGTGQQIPITNSSPQTYISGQQYLYGVWDWNLTAWNSKATVKYAALLGPQTVNASTLVTQTVTSITQAVTGDTTALAYETISSNPICWATGSGTGSCNNFGWKVPLPSSNEQIVYNPTLINGNFVVNTIIPANTTTLSCLNPTPTGFTMALAIGSGSAPATPPFTNNNHDGLYEQVNGMNQAVIGEQQNGTGTPSLFNNDALITQTINGKPKAVNFNPGADVKGQRLTWIQKR